MTWAVGCSEGWSALQWAVHKQLPEIVELLIRSGAATAEEDKVRCSQCHRARARNDARMHDREGETAAGVYLCLMLPPPFHALLG